VRDTEYIWCKASVEKVIWTATNKWILYVHYDWWNWYYDEYIPERSEWIAPLGLYTGWTDVPRYDQQ